MAATNFKDYYQILGVSKTATRPFGSKCTENNAKAETQSL